MTTRAKTNDPHPPTPCAPPPIDDLPHPLTIFVTERDRKRIIAALRRIHTDRAAALLLSLGLSEGDRA